MVKIKFQLKKINMKKCIILITGLLPLMGSAQLVMTNNYYMVMNGGNQTNPTSIVLTNPSPAGITNAGTGWIISENEFNQVDWNIGTNTGNYIVPFGYANTDYIPVTCNITNAGTGNGSIKFSTYHGSSWENSIYQPSDVTNMTDFSLADYSKATVDRFWILDASGYTTKPTPTIKFTYIRSGASSEITSPNYLTESSFIAQRYNSGLNEWYDFFGTTGTDITTANTGTVSSGLVAPVNFYRSWSLFNDSTLLTSVREVNIISSPVIAFPNPTNGSFTVSGLLQGQTIELYDYLGQMLISLTVDKPAMIIDISTKANGIYLMKIQNKDGSFVTQRKIMKIQ
jgi:hypothetical protein